MRYPAKAIAALAAAMSAVSLGAALAITPGVSATGPVTAAFALVWNWGSGYEASYTITNNTPAVVTGWTVAFDLPGGQMGNYWNALETTSGNHISFTDRDYNSTVPANGGAVSFGFIVTGAFSPPANCTVNGSPCDGTAPQPATSSPPSTPAQQAPSPANSPAPPPPSTHPAPSTQPAPSTPPAAPPAGTSGSFAVAPYVDMSNNQEGMLDQAAHNGLKAFTAAFVTGSGCTPVWGDTLPVSNDPTITGEITRAESEGATPIVSFGGAVGAELASSCPNLGQLTAAYQSVINTLHVTHLDFDIEGAAIANTAASNLRFQAIKALEAANPGLVVSLTIPVLPTGPDGNGQAFLRLARSSGAGVSIVNVMAMDYGAAFDTGGPNMGSDAVQAAQGTLSFLQSAFPGASYSMVGVTPMIGQNDDSAEIFTQADAQTLVSFAQQHHLGRLAFWSVDRDQPCSGSASALSQCSMTSQQALGFTKIFAGFTG
jgi:hypothetical protein